MTGLSSTERKEVQRLCEQHGATYTGQLKMNECTHLIVSEPSGKWLSLLTPFTNPIDLFTLSDRSELQFSKGQYQQTQNNLPLVTTG